MQKLTKEQSLASLFPDIDLKPSASADFRIPPEPAPSQLPFELSSNDTGAPPLLVSTEKQSALIKDTVYYMDTVVFKIKDHLFKVPAHYFKQGTSFFSQDFASLDAGKKIDDEEFIELKDVTPDEFRALLKFIYPIQSNRLQQVPPAPTTNEWITILKLSTQWMMLDIRRVAIEALSSAKILPVERVVLAREYKVKFWLRSAYLELAQTASSMTRVDMEKIGLTTAFKIHKARERYMATPRGFGAFDQSPSLHYGRSMSSQPFSYVEDREDREDIVKRGPVERVPLARKQGVSEWLRDAFIELVKRHEPLTVEESETLGFDTAICLYSTRERRLPRRTERSSKLSVESTNPVDQDLRKELEALDSYQPVERAVLAQRYGVMEWLRQAFVDLMERPEALSTSEAKALGYETAIRLAIAREAYTRTLNSRFAYPAYDEDTIGTFVDEELKSELSAISSYGPVDRVLMAREAGVEEWLQPALNELVNRKEILSDEEAIALGLDTCIQLSRFRLDNLGNSSTPSSSWADPGQIEAEFQEELSEIGEAGERYVQPGTELPVLDNDVERTITLLANAESTRVGKKRKVRKVRFY